MNTSERLQGALLTLTLLLVVIVGFLAMAYVDSQRERDITCRAGWALTERIEEEILFARAASWCRLVERP